jgi:hypothetical protein
MLFAGRRLQIPWPVPVRLVDFLLARLRGTQVVGDAFQHFGSVIPQLFRRHGRGGRLDAASEAVPFSENGVDLIGNKVG